MHLSSIDLERGGSVKYFITQGNIAPIPRRVGSINDILQPKKRYKLCMERIKNFPSWLAI